ncbi:DNA-binding XRE family transcriptional regulator [Hydrogenispora ethanolica]|jgi:transcriptional regulator with XRE-family HTH domain|uniref:DNA-binding XRE family transcriptional regulator n=1 Tax=Hydrogenispora ethanolica TaxID=1082276 RepID=A0A4V2QG29_HYDET|nr:helix-turn-helix transcriptional regulator [Hydrogenispora ethanolica]TCL74187.1 DNA-binding XRE family transcriptional regulator [Hydrogenispora ethanolica]
MELGPKIKALREQSGMSMNALARLSGVAQSSLSGIESGKQYPTFDNLERIIKALGLTLSDFFSEEKPDYSPEIQKLLVSVQTLPPAYIDKVTDFALLMHSMLDLPQLEKDLKQSE